MALKSFLLTDTSPAAAGTSASAVAAGSVSGLEEFDWFTVDALLLGATGGTLDVYLQRWVQKLQEWRDWVHFTQLAAAAAATRYTFDCNAMPTSITTVGQATTPVISAGVVTCGHPGTKLRLLFTAGASTSAGAIQKVELTGWRKR